MPQFYTLEEAARLLGVTPEEVRRMAERNELRAFRDRGTMRFRGPEIEEMARRRGRGSDPELQLGEAIPPRPGDSSAPRQSKLAKDPAAPRKSKLAKDKDPDVFDFALTPDDSDQVEIGQELRVEGGSSASRSGSSSSRKNTSGPKSPPPKPGSDSDVRLVPDGSDLDFEVAHEKPPSGTGSRKSGLGGKSSKSRLDSGVQMVPLEGDDSGVPLGKSPAQSPSDSDIRLNRGRPSTLHRGPDEPMLTEEIDLDAELRQASDSAARKGGSGSFAGPSDTSPFELSVDDLDLPAEEDAGTTDGSSDFELTPAAFDESPVEPSSGEMAAAADDDDEVSLGELSSTGGESGINLRDPADSGISLEQGGSSEELEFELSLDADATPPPSKAPVMEDSDSEFELTLDDDSSVVAEPSAEEEESVADDSSSEFELTLDADAGLMPDDSSPVEADSSSPVDSDLDSSPVDSDSEFELTLDDSAELAPLEEEAVEEPAAEEEDIFETDFDVPALDEESGSEAVALEDADADMETSDFDLALGDEDIAAEDESGSQVVALEEEEAEDEEETPRRGRRGAVLEEDSEDVDELFNVGDEEDEAAAEEEGQPAAVAAPTEWGSLPAIVMLPCVIIMFLVTLMSYELVRRDGLNNPNMLTKALSGLFQEEK